MRYSVFFLCLFSLSACGVQTEKVENETEYKVGPIPGFCQSNIAPIVLDLPGKTPIDRAEELAASYKYEIVYAEIHARGDRGPDQVPVQAYIKTVGNADVSTSPVCSSGVDESVNFTLNIAVPQVYYAKTVDQGGIAVRQDAYKKSNLSLKMSGSTVLRLSHLSNVYSGDIQTILNGFDDYRIYELNQGLYEIRYRKALNSNGLSFTVMGILQYNRSAL